MSEASIVHVRARHALQLAFVADALGAPAHWFYSVSDIRRVFGSQGIQEMVDTPSSHPGAIMSLHSTGGGGRGDHSGNIVGDVILKGRRHLWGSRATHYHHGFQAGDNTLNAAVVSDVLLPLSRSYDLDAYLEAYVKYMTSDPPPYKDTYAESYHREFFANRQRGKPLRQCAGSTHDTPSIGAFVSASSLALVELTHDRDVAKVAARAGEHMMVAGHPDPNLKPLFAKFVGLLDALLYRDEKDDVRAIIQTHSEGMGVNVRSLDQQAKDDTQVCGGKYSPACYISGSLPSVLYFAYRYASRPREGLLANVNCGGDNVHRGYVLGIVLGLCMDASQQEALWFDKLTRANELKDVISKCID